MQIGAVLTNLFAVTHVRVLLELRREVDISSIIAFARSCCEHGMKKAVIDVAGGHLTSTGHETTLHACE